ncbi:uncharacterized protein CC84DRAFT_1175281 [Paraphaeosphaeria sporulosa]|uniref:Uncharacterized protein n=1 Tax=Paraphaeosphaeria sporulosa TaxID=1460663 RepID=A0A177CJQ5_9PLEO|nr:uncharacterized protein CC84DRAFT_1175281 [Paraphaeosphaeria sporulosa]OAG07481.1 hypothetical protein CC84DRAFT_1175281 [Paraphaeosphaeria sporulosa]
MSDRCCHAAEGDVQQPDATAALGNTGLRLEGVKIFDDSLQQPRSSPNLLSRDAQLHLFSTSSHSRNLPIATAAPNSEPNPEHVLHEEKQAHSAEESTTARTVLWALAESAEVFTDLENSLHDSDLHPGAPWGFVVVRTVYGSFARMLEELTSNNRETLEDAQQGHVFLRHKLTILNNKATLNSADCHTVLRCFTHPHLSVGQFPDIKVVTINFWGGRAATIVED